jgi:hypothetical protein
LNRGGINSTNLTDFKSCKEGLSFHVPINKNCENY